MPETAKRTARVPILGEDGRISDDAIPAAFGENVTQAESAATRAESAKTDAEAAKTGAESFANNAVAQAQAAKESADGARGSASRAQQSATAAQRSATEAGERADSVLDHYVESATATTLDPGQPATAEVVDKVLNLGIPRGEKGDRGDTGTGVPEGGTPGQLLSKTDSGTAWVDPPSTGNVPKRTVSDKVAHGEDAFAQKPIEVRVKGRTVKNLWPVINSSQGSDTVSTDETGLITVKATPESTLYATADAQGAAANKSYTLTASNLSNASSSTWTIYVEERDAGGTYINSYLLTSSRSSATFTTAANCAQLVCMIIVYAGNSANLTTRAMLVEGGTAPDCFVPTGLHSVEPTNLVTAGKNLLSSSTFTGGAGQPGVLNLSLPAGTYTLSCYNAEDWWTGNSDGLNWYIHEAVSKNAVVAANMSSPSVGSRSHATFTLPYSGDFVLYTYKTDIAEMATDLQLELGSTATAYEPPAVTTAPLPEVELRSLPNGTCDELVIGADGTATVERRTQLTGGEVTALPEPTTETLDAVSLPKLPAPTFNIHHDSQVPSDTSVEYERDINLVLANLEAVQAALLGGE